MLWYVAGSVLAGSMLGGALGAIGSIAMAGTSARVGMGVLALVVATGIALDLGVLGRRLPTMHRQVNEDWLARYRGWVYGLGFGLQLGAGFATVVTVSAVYGAFAAALLSGSVRAGLLIGGAFGLARGATLLAAAGVRRADQLVGVDSRLRRWDRPSRRLAIAIEAMLLVVAALSLVT